MLSGFGSVSTLQAGSPTAADACTPFRYVPSTEATVRDVPESFLLSVQRDGTPDSFLLGTFHSADPVLRERWETVVLLLGRRSTRRVFTERAPDGLLSPGADPRLLPADERLRDVLDGDGPLAGRLTRLLRDRGLPPDAYDRYRPWVAAALVSQAPARRGRSPILDEVVRSHAEGLGLPVSALESLDALAQAHERGLSGSDQRRILAEAVCNAAQTARVVERLIRAYAENAPAPFMAEMGRLRSKDPSFESRMRGALVEERTARFWERLAPEFERGGVLAAVGNLHVSGRRGLAARLSQAGFRVEPIQPGSAGYALDPDLLQDLARWAGEWTRTGPEGPGALAGLRVEPRSVVTLRRVRCGGRPCRIDGTYVARDRSILLEMGIYTRLLRWGPAAPRRRLDEKTAYAESILVRELVRHLLRTGEEGMALDTSSSGPGEPGSVQRDAFCRANRTLNRAARAQADFLRERGAQARARVFPLSALCPDPETNGR